MILSYNPANFAQQHPSAQISPSLRHRSNFSLFTLHYLPPSFAVFEAHVVLL